MREKWSRTYMYSLKFLYTRIGFQISPTLQNLRSKLSNFATQQNPLKKVSNECIQHSQVVTAC